MEKSELDGNWKNYSSYIYTEHIFKNGKRQFKKYYVINSYVLREGKYIDLLPDGYFEHYFLISISFL